MFLIAIVHSNSFSEDGTQISECPAGCTEAERLNIPASAQQTDALSLHAPPTQTNASVLRKLECLP